MVATVTRLNSGVGNYHLSLVRKSYLEAGEPPGTWHGEGAALLELSGQVTREALSNLAQGLSPDGKERLVKNAGSESRTPAFEACFSVPKGASLLWVMSSPEERRGIEHDVLSAAMEAMDFGAQHLFQIRRGKGGTEREPAKMLFADFEHGSSRPTEKNEPPDPQLHHHVLIPNVALREDGTSGSLDARSAFRHKLTLGAIFDLACSNAIQKRFGLEVEKTEKGFWDVSGISRDTIREFSKRREAIEARLSEELMGSSKAREAANLHSRLHKKPLPREELFKTWRERAQDLGFTRKHLETLFGSIPPSTSRKDRLEASLNAALKEITEQQSHFSFPELVRHAAQAAHGTGLTPADVIQGAKTLLAHSQEIIPLSEFRGESHFTTRELFETERDLLRSAVGRLKDIKTHVLPDRTVAKGLAKAFRKFEPSDEQRNALAHLTQKPGAIQILTGEAGTGKSTLLEALRIAYEKKGIQVQGAALASRTARGLERDSGIKSATIAKLLTLDEKSTLRARIKENLTLKPLIWDLTHGRGVRNRPLFGKPPLPHGVVLVVDEAGMVGTRDLSRLVKMVEKAKGKLILVGDPEQLQPIAAGLPIAALSRALGEAKLTKILRQKEEWARAAIRDFRHGNARRALNEHAKRGLLSVGRTTDEATRRLVADWQEAKAPLSQKLVLAATNLQVRSLNERIQSERLRCGELGNESVVVGATRFFTHDRVIFTKNLKTLGVDNGDMGTVFRARDSKGTIRIKLDRGQTVTVTKAETPNLSLGYALTTHKAQGVTVDLAFVLVGGSSQTKEISYVQASRARHATRFYTTALVAGDDLHDLARSMNRSLKKDIAHDLVH